MIRSRSKGWQAAMQLHTAAAAELARTAASVPSDQWRTPRAPGKWTPAEILAHLILAYEVLLRELRGGGGMALRTRWWQRVLLHFTVRRRILSGGGFPAGARAPRELGPPDVTLDQNDALERFRELAAEFEAAMETARMERPRSRLTHAYFGARPLEEALGFCARHIQHHHQQLHSLTEQDAGVR
ncbi:MAG TPA: DinB family protein [Longimicrobiaceae bacterium]|nr:DinB family protein [Longimicrobiaceae bacterium]